MDQPKNKLGRLLTNKHRRRNKHSNDTIQINHNYDASGHMCDGASCNLPSCLQREKLLRGVDRTGWRNGRRIIEWGVLLDSLKHCHSCKLGPIPLTVFNLAGEEQRGLGGYLYVQCQNPSCLTINRVPYGKTHRSKGGQGRPCFSINSKLGLGKCKYLCQCNTTSALPN